MELIGHGIDLVNCRKIEAILGRHKERFLARVFTGDELAYSQKHRHSVERMAGRLAVKEAVMKLLGTGWQSGIAWTDIETLNDKAGKPVVFLRGKVAELAEQMGIDKISVSITHTADLAIASVIGLGKQP